jgi:YidC/Oxa1 family membrane protein insertase
MDRRTLLAFALIFVILIGSQFVIEKLYGGKDSAVSTESATEPATVTAGEVADEVSGFEPATTEQAASGGSSYERPDATTPAEPPTSIGTSTVTTAEQALAVIDDGQTAENIVVNTPLYRAVVSTRGGRITSFKLAEHKLYTGDSVELIPQGEDATIYGTDAVIFERGRLELGDVRFSYDGARQLEIRSSEPEQRVVLTIETAGGLTVRKTLTFYPDGYNIDQELVVLGGNSGQLESTLRMIGDPERALFGWNQGIASTERNKRNETPAFRSFAQVGDELYIKKRGGLSKSVEKVEGLYSGSVIFAGLQNKFFMATGVVAVAGKDPVEGRVILSGDQVRDQQTWLIELPLRRQFGGGDLFARSQIRLFIGPQERDRLTAYGVGLEKTIDLGFKLFRPLAEAVLWILSLMSRFIPNYGVVIILFSLATKLLFYPLTRKSTESMKRMQELQPKIKALQEKYKDNKEKQSKATMELYKTEKINPMAGCLPLLVQMPVFIALYQSLMHTIALRNTPFMLWINDLSQPDAMFQLPFALPFLGSEFNLLPILMTGLMVVQTKLTPTGAAGGQMAAMNTVMPVVMLFIFYQMPSGLVLYWLVNTVMTIYQTWRIHKTTPTTGGAQTT